MHDDWRLPTKEELVLLAKSQKLKKRFHYLDTELYWSSDVDKKDDLNSITVYMGNGFISATDACDKEGIICVRDAR
jgi:hypothetical protein